MGSGLVGVSLGHRQLGSIGQVIPTCFCCGFCQSGISYSSRPIEGWDSHILHRWSSLSILDSGRCCDCLHHGGASDEIALDHLSKGIDPVDLEDLGGNHHCFCCAVAVIGCQLFNRDDALGDDVALDK